MACAKLFSSEKRMLFGGRYFLTLPHFLIHKGRRGCKSELPSHYNATIPKAGPLVSCIAKITENRKCPERPIISGFPGIDTKTAFQIGRLFQTEDKPGLGKSPKPGIFMYVNNSDKNMKRCSLNGRSIPYRSFIFANFLRFIHR